MKEQFSRMENMMGAEALERLQRSCVAVFGIGGVGGYATEALDRSGVGRLILVDKDVVSISNLNRQLIATYSSIGRPKVEAMKARIQDINPDCQVETYECFYLPENKEVFDFTQYDYVIDAVDTVTAKIQLVLQAQEAGVPIISSMGTGNKLDPSRLQVADIYKTKVCPLAKVMRHELKKRNIKKLKVVYSEELPMESKCYDETIGKAIPGSMVFVPGAAGLLLAAEVVKELMGV